MRYYFVITYLPEQRDNNLLASRFIKALHKFNGKFQLHNIGVSFPNWSNASVGNQIAFVCEDKKILMKLWKLEDINLMREYGLINLIDISEVKENLHEEVCFIHNKLIDKHTVKGKRRVFKRLKKRALERGELSYTPKHNKNAILTVKPYQNILMSSSSTKQENYGLYIQLTSSEKECFGCFNTYGLATTHKWRGSVPLHF